MFDFDGPVGRYTRWLVKKCRPWWLMWIIQVPILMVVWHTRRTSPFIGWSIAFLIGVGILLPVLLVAGKLMWETRHIHRLDPIFDENDEIRASFARGEITEEEAENRLADVRHRAVEELRKQGIL